MVVRTRPKDFTVEESPCYRQCQLCHHGVQKGEQYVIGRGIYVGTVCMDCARLIAGAMK